MRVGAGPANILVTCLMVTLAVPGRLVHVRASIAAFIQQSHHLKELLIVVNGGTDTARRILVNYILSLGRSDIRIVEPLGDRTLGELRNISIECASGEVLCQWDDDDLYHPERIERQLAALLQAEQQAVYLQDIMQLVSSSRSLYWTNWHATEAGCHPGTLMAWRTASIHYSTTGPTARLGEDMMVALGLRTSGGVGLLMNMPHLFIYVSHGDNSWDQDHHRMLAKELTISNGLLRRREKAIRLGLQPFDFGSLPLGVHGSTGLAFTLEPEQYAPALGLDHGNRTIAADTMAGRLCHDSLLDSVVNCP